MATTSIGRNTRVKAAKGAVLGKAVRDYKAKRAGRPNLAMPVSISDARDVGMRR
ncbi:MAG: hypothetical protein IKG21_12120 [Atopobiaceae bacterium]|nr:hypothetical protein [Atopobiaceae bacterium]